MMNSMFNYKTIIGVLGTLLILLGCVKDTDFDAPKLQCINENLSNITIGQVTDLYVDQTVQIQENWILEGYVVSSDHAGNFFNVLYF